ASSVATAPGSTTETRTWLPVTSLRRASVNAPHAVLGEVVDGTAAAGLTAGDGADVHHVAGAPRAVLGGPYQLRQGGVGAVEQTQQVDVHHLLPLLEGGPGDGAEQHHARVVDQRVEATELPHRALDGVLGLAGVGDVCRE